jgi:hypothetical protein
MKTTILALGIAAFAAFSGSSGANAGSTLPTSLESPAAFSPVTFSGDYRRHGDYGWRKAHYRWHTAPYYDPLYQGGLRDYCFYHPYSEWCHRRSW